MVCCCNCPTVDQCLSPLVAAGKMDGGTGKTNDIRLLGNFFCHSGNAFKQMKAVKGSFGGIEPN